MVSGKNLICTDIHASDYQPRLPPVDTVLTTAEVDSKITAHPSASSCAIRLISQLEEPPHETGPTRSVPFSENVIQEAIWSSTDYYNLWHNPAGGSSALLSNPWRFIMQTPSDGKAFCSFAISVHGTKVKGIYTYNDPIFSPSRILADESISSAWMAGGLQIVSLPLAFLKAHSVRMAQDLAVIVGQVSSIERTLAEPGPLASVGSRDEMQDFSPLTRKLHACSSALVDLERRSKFESTLADAIEAVLKTRDRNSKRDASAPWAPLDVQRNMMASRTYDFETLPKRIQEQRSTIFNLIVQHNQQVNLDIGRANMQIAESSRRIAEATMSDSASMKTIAILTMVFLPGTAVASFFSMTMFNWSADSGQSLASVWLWVYFVAAVPLTAVVLAVWWVCTKRREKELRRKNGRAADGDRFSDLEMAVRERESPVEVEEISEEFEEAGKMS